jgi:hypothetical protein
MLARKRRDLADVAGSWKPEKRHTLVLHSRDEHFEHFPQVLRV